MAWPHSQNNHDTPDDGHGHGHGTTKAREHNNHSGRPARPNSAPARRRRPGQNAGPPKGKNATPWAPTASLMRPDHTTPLANHAHRHRRPQSRTGGLADAYDGTGIAVDHGR